MIMATHIWLEVFMWFASIIHMYRLTLQAIVVCVVLWTLWLEGLIFSKPPPTFQSFLSFSFSGMNQVLQNRSRTVTLISCFLFCMQVRVPDDSRQQREASDWAHHRE